MPEKLHIDFVSDVSCSWCAVGLRNLEQAIDNLGGEVEVEIRFRPFELNPQMPASGQNLFEHLREKYGWDETYTVEAMEQVRRSGEPVGIDFRIDRDSHVYNSFDLHRLLHWAGIHGKQKELKQALFTVHFTQGKDLRDQDMLSHVAQSVGLDAGEARDILAGDAYAGEVRADERVWLDAGVRSVPAMIFNGLYAVSGAQPPAALEQVIRRTLADSGKGKEGRA